MSMSHVELLRRSRIMHRNPTCNAEGYRGIWWDREHAKWRAEIRFMNRRYRLGRYKTPEAAAAAYNEAAEKFHGEHAVINEFGLPKSIGSRSEPQKRVKRRLKRFYVEQAAKRNQVSETPGCVVECGMNAGLLGPTA